MKIETSFNVMYKANKWLNLTLIPSIDIGFVYNTIIIDFSYLVFEYRVIIRK